MLGSHGAHAREGAAAVVAAGFVVHGPVVGEGELSGLGDPVLGVGKPLGEDGFGAGDLGKCASCKVNTDLHSAHQDPFARFVQYNFACDGV